MDYVVFIPIIRSQLLELFALLDQHDPEWRYFSFSTYDTCAMEYDRHIRIRVANEGFIDQVRTEGNMRMRADTMVCVTARTAMTLRLSYPDVVVTSLKEFNNESKDEQ